jgi:hypothetical protein
MARELHRTASEGEASVRDALRAFLEARRDRICAELGEHPRPVAACDVHYNRLLEDRTAVCRELDRLQALRGRVEDFVRSCVCLDEEARRRLLLSLGPSGAGPATRP